MEPGSLPHQATFSGKYVLDTEMQWEKNNKRGREKDKKSGDWVRKLKEKGKKKEEK